MSYRPSEYQPVRVVAQADDAEPRTTLMEGTEAGEEEGASPKPAKRRGCCSCVRNIFSVGCAVAVITCLYFFIVIPTGVLLVLHGHNRSSALTLSLGSAILFIFTCALPTVFLCIRYRRTKREFRLHARQQRHRKVAEAVVDVHTAVVLKSTSAVRGSCDSGCQSVV